MSNSRRTLDGIIQELEELRATCGRLVAGPTRTEMADRIDTIRDDVFKLRSVLAKEKRDKEGMNYAYQDNWYYLAKLLREGNIDEIMVNFAMFFPSEEPPFEVDE